MTPSPERAISLNSQTMQIACSNFLPAATCNLNREVTVPAAIPKLTVTIPTPGFYSTISSDGQAMGHPSFNRMPVLSVPYLKGRISVEITANASVSELTIIVLSPGPHTPIFFYGKRMVFAGTNILPPNPGPYSPGDISVIIAAVSKLTITVASPGP